MNGDTTKIRLYLCCYDDAALNQADSDEVAAEAAGIETVSADEKAVNTEKAAFEAKQFVKAKETLATSMTAEPVAYVTVRSYRRRLEGADELYKAAQKNKALQLS